MNESFNVRDIRKSNWFWANTDILKSKMTGSQKLVYLGLCVFANSHTQVCFPKIDTLEIIAGISRRSVFYALNSLERCRLISINHSKGRGKSNEYTLLDLKGANLALIEKGAPRRIQKVQLSDIKGANKAPPTSVIEPSKEQVLSLLEEMRKKYGKPHKLVV